MDHHTLPIRATQSTSVANLAASPVRSSEILGSAKAFDVQHKQRHGALSRDLAQPLRRRTV